ncbi:MAG TPA: membrane protein insertase YidC [Verrucomicrobiae bacterium]|nr:membrane protein insertase YidC [Verrucomicrobiae bacterium]
MDRKSFIILAICGALFLVWVYLTPRLYPPGSQTAGTNSVATGTNAALPRPPAATDTADTTTIPPKNFIQPATNSPEEIFVLTNGLVRMTFTSRGGGIKLVELLQHRESVTCRAKKEGINRPVTLNDSAALPVLALASDESMVGDGVYRLSFFPVPAPARAATNALAALTPTQGVRAEKLLSNGVFVVKEFVLGPEYLITASVQFENRSTGPLVLPQQSWMVGAATPLNAQDRGDTVGLMWFNGKSVSHADSPYFENKTLGCFPGTPISDYAQTNVEVRWAAARNQFFFIALMPELPGTSVIATKFTLPPPSQEEIASDATTRTNQQAFNVVMTQPATNIAAGEVLKRTFHVYAGPKENRRLELLASQMKNEIDRLMEFGWFGWFSRILLTSMNGLNALGLSYALSIIAITVIIKLLFWPLTQASTRSMKRMQALQPQMKAIQEKYKDDPVKMNKKVMEFMREHKVSPLGGCLPVLLQVPVFIGFFQMVRTAIELRGASFLWACDLSRSDTIFVIPGVNFNVNPLPLLMGLTMFWQARLTPPAPGMDPVQQKMMKYFPLIFLFILYDYSAGLTLYWTVQNLLSIAQTKLTRISEEKKGSEPAKPVPTLPNRRKK